MTVTQTIHTYIHDTKHTTAYYDMGRHLLQILLKALHTYIDKMDATRCKVSCFIRNWNFSSQEKFRRELCSQLQSEKHCIARCRKTARYTRPTKTGSNIKRRTLSHSFIRSFIFCGIRAHLQLATSKAN